MAWYISCYDPYQPALPTARAYAHSLGYRTIGYSGEIVEEPDPLGGCTLRIGFTDPDKVEDNRIEITLRRHLIFGRWAIRGHSIRHVDWKR